MSPRTGCFCFVLYIQPAGQTIKNKILTKCQKYNVKDGGGGGARFLDVSGIGMLLLFGSVKCNLKRKKIKKELNFTNLSGDSRIYTLFKH